MLVSHNQHCMVFLTGSLLTMPTILEKEFQKIAIMVSRKHYCTDDRQEKIESYRVILNEKDATRILQLGFLGMQLIIQGDFRLKENIDIIAEKVDFPGFPTPQNHHKKTVITRYDDGLYSAQHTIH